MILNTDETVAEKSHVTRPFEKSNWSMARDLSLSQPFLAISKSISYFDGWLFNLNVFFTYGLGLEKVTDGDELKFTGVMPSRLLEMDPGL